MAPDPLPPAQPVYVLRGHSSTIHALHFMRKNTRLLTGDSDGWVVSWSTVYKRPVAVWRAHQDGHLGIGSWGNEVIITHGRDNKLNIWQLSEIDEDSMDKSLPIDDTNTERRQPRLLHILTVNALNFCSFTLCLDDAVEASSEIVSKQGSSGRPAILIAVPNTIDSNGIDIFQLPSERRLSSVEAEKDIKTGMVMALEIHSQKSLLQVAAGFESGHLIIYRQRNRDSTWQNIYYYQAHSQPILSVSIFPKEQFVLSSSADALIVRHPLPLPDPDLPPDERSPLPTHPANAPLKVLQTKHSGQQSLTIRSDGKIVATAGWDGRIRVYGTKKLREVAVLKWHKQGCYTVTFGEMVGSDVEKRRDGEVQVTGDESKEGEKEGEEQSNALTTLELGSESVISTISQKRLRKVQQTHWVAAGGKDGKVSLWDIF
ncbi:MAG: ASTRA complex subunit [Icmadophila ericetorum]|nr:ASTRA complex subunit [Icmadophila ericetorum]